MTTKQQRSVAGKAVRLAVLWLLFWLGCWLAPFVVLAWKLLPEGYAKNVGRSADRMNAALVGKTGKFTLSAECAFAETKRMIQLRDMLDYIKEDHCINEATDEGAYCRISDHLLGGK